MPIRTVATAIWSGSNCVLVLLSLRTPSYTALRTASLMSKNSRNRRAAVTFNRPASSSSA